MESETLRTRLAQLVQKSRKAARLYSGFERFSEGEQSEYTSSQLEQWQSVNEELQRLLATAIDKPNQRGLAQEVFSIRDRFYAEWRRCESDVRLRQAELISSAEKGDFVRAAMLGRALVTQKAREQAAQAALHELQEVISKSRLVPPPLPSENPILPGTSGSPLVNSMSVGSAPTASEVRESALPVQEKSVQLAKVIPLRNRHG